MEFSSDLLDAARDAYENEFSGRQNLGTADALRFKNSLGRLCPEAKDLSLIDCEELLKAICGRGEPTDESRPARSKNADRSDSVAEKFGEYNNALNEASDEESAEMTRVPVKTDRREAIRAINSLLETYYPHKTIFAAFDFDKIRALYAERFPLLGRDVSDFDLKALLFSAGATLIGRLIPREERLKALPNDGYDSGCADSSVGKSLVRPSQSRYREATPNNSPGYSAEGNSFSSATEFEYYLPKNDFSGRETNDDRDNSEGRRGGDDVEGSRVHDEPRLSESGESSEESRVFPYGSELLPNEERHRRVDGFLRNETRSRATQVSSGNFDDEDVKDQLEKFLSQSENQTSDSRFSFAEAVRAAREVLQKFFPYQRVRGYNDLLKFRRFLEMRFPRFDYDNEKLYMLVKYAGGVYIGSYSSIFEGFREEPRVVRKAVGNSAFEVPLSLQPVLQGTKEIVDEFFPTKVVYAPGDVARFSKLFHQRFRDVRLPETSLVVLLENVGVEIRRQDEEEISSDVDFSLDEAYVDVAKLALKEHFPRTEFKKDLSDFKRFRFVFEEEAGANAKLSDEKLRDIFLAAGGVFADDSANFDKSPKTPPEVLSRADVIKRVVSSDFLRGLDPKSNEDLDKFRKIAKSRYGMDFFGESDSKLASIIARCVISFDVDGKFYCVDDKTRDLIKQRVISLFAVGARVVYYEPFFKNNFDWLNKAGIYSVELFKFFLYKYYSSYLFYRQYFEQTESFLSERVKVENEIERVWGASVSLSAADLGDRLCVPVDRIEKALELDVDKFKRASDGSYTRLEVVGSSCDPKSLDELFDGSFEESREQKTDVAPDDRKEVVTEDLEKKALTPPVEKSDDVINPQDASSLELTPEALVFIKSQIDSWFEEGGKFIYYQAFFDRWSGKMDEYGIADQNALKSFLRATYPDYVFYDDYFEKEENAEDVVFKLKREMDRVWSEDTPARRVVDLIKSLYITKEAFEIIIEEEENLDALGVDKRSNGYLVRKPKKSDGKRPRRVLKLKRKSNKTDK